MKTKGKKHYYWPPSMTSMDEAPTCTNCIYCWCGEDAICILFPDVEGIIGVHNTDYQKELSISPASRDGAVVPPLCGQGRFVIGEPPNRKTITLREWMEIEINKPHPVDRPD